MTGEREPLLKKEVGWWITIIALLMGVAVGWGSLNAKVDALCDRVNEQNVRIAALEATVATYRDEVTDNDVRLARIETDLAYIRTAIDRLETKGTDGQ